MKIAVATDDFVNVTGHVGRCKGFIIFDIENQKIKNVEERENNFTHHKLKNNHSNSHEHSHNNLLEGLKDCSQLICTSAGWRLREDLESAKKEVIFTSEKIAEDAVKKLLDGTLEINEAGVCRAH